jgi:hypothetical protein
MKRTKKPLALLLTLALAFSLALPAMAISYQDITITGPEGPVPFGEAFTLRVEADLPAGMEIVSYQWQGWIDDWWQPLEGATASTLRVTSGDAYYPKASKPYESTGKKDFDCIITFVEKDAGGNVIDTISIESNYVKVQVGPERDRNFWETVWEDYFLEPFGGGLATAMIVTFWSGGFLIILAPVAFLVGWIGTFFSQLFGLQ